MTYDSTQDTLKHIKEVRTNLMLVGSELETRALDHDKSKLHSPEKELFDEFTPNLRDTTYGSDEYKAHLREMGKALEHHYAHNSHHPEHYENGIEGMSLLDVIEMLCDWNAAAKRRADGDIFKSIEINAERFGISDQLKAILVNTALELWD